MTLPPAPSQEGELVAGLRMNQLIQTFFVPRRGAFVYPSPPSSGRGVGRGAPDESVDSDFLCPGGAPLSDHPFVGISGLFIQSNDHPSLSL